jgi:hypothetical protein
MEQDVPAVDVTVFLPKPWYAHDLYCTNEIRIIEAYGLSATLATIESAVFGHVRMFAPGADGEK